MKGIWRLPTRTIDQGLSITVYDGIVALVILLITGFAIWRKSKYWPECWPLHTGLVFLSIWFILHWIDVLVHNRQVSVFYSYIIMDSIASVFKSLSDFFSVWGTWKICIRYKYLHPKFFERPMFGLTTTVACVLGTLALYHICLLWALTFAWLSFSDLSVINSIAKGARSFEVAFTSLQFCSVVIGTYGISEYVSNKTGHYNEQAFWALQASIALTLRSFCEVVIVGQLDRSPTHIDEIAKGRDVTYGLFSLYFAATVAFAVPSKTDKDPLVDKSEELILHIRSEALRKIQEASNDGKKTAPTISSVLDTMENSLDNRENRFSQDFCTKRNEIRRLRKLYGEWQPICKWDGDGASL